MMVCIFGDPEMFRVALDVGGSPAQVQILHYYQPWLYTR